ncbi:MAG TPA: ATP-binding protein [Candidatus Sulfotelmatobacter sp.]|nr:ATP-binding protein [Candidatus Sulfotelmatobacter sp.]
MLRGYTLSGGAHIQEPTMHAPRRCSLKPKILLSWSSGKDSAWTLHVLRQRGDVEIVGLLTTINTHFQRVAMHGTRYALLQMQAKAAGIPLWEIPLPWPCNNETYEQAMSAACASAVEKGISAIAFGDLFLEDVRRYREDRLRGTGLQPLFPLWDLNTRGLIEEMIDAGLRARIICADPTKLSSDFLGRDLDHELVRRMPAGVDPCGENGEFHTFAYSGPMFSQSIPIKSGESVTRDGFCYADVVPCL